MLLELATATPASHHRRDSELVCAGFADWRCWISVDTAKGLDRLKQLFECHLWSEPTPGQLGLELSLANEVAPRLRIISQGETVDFRELLKAPEQKGFQHLVDDRRSVYFCEPFGHEPFIEVQDGVAIILQPNYWPMMIQLVFVMLLLHENPVVNLHAAVSAIDDHSLVLIGPSGAGKSTLSWALHQQGCDVYGDEWTFFTLPEYHQHVWRRSICLRPRGMSLLENQPMNASWYEAKPNDPKCAVTLPEPSRPCPRDSASLIFMDGFAEKPSLKPMPGGLAVQRLLQGMGYGDPSIAARLDVAADLVNHFPCRRLAVGKPEETAALLVEYARGRS